MSMFAYFMPKHLLSVSCKNVSHQGLTFYPCAAYATKRNDLCLTFKKGGYHES